MTVRFNSSSVNRLGNCHRARQGAGVIKWRLPCSVRVPVHLRMAPISCPVQACDVSLEGRGNSAALSSKTRLTFPGAPVATRSPSCQSTSCVFPGLLVSTLGRDSKRYLPGERIAVPSPRKPTARMPPSHSGATSRLIAHCRGAPTSSLEYHLHNSVQKQQGQSASIQECQVPWYRGSSLSVTCGNSRPTSVPDPPSSGQGQVIERRGSGVDRLVPQFGLDAQQTIVLCYSLRAGRRPGLDLSHIPPHGEVSDRRVLRLP